MEEPVTIAIARTGTFEDSRGREHTFTTQDFDRIAANYDPASEDDKAPLVFGHPQDNHPAFGWATKVYREGRKLFAQFAHVPDSVRQAVRKKHYTRVSMSLHPGGKRLRHVGLLGAVPPAIPGLGPMEMGSGEEAVTFNFMAAELGELPQRTDNKGAETMGEDAKRLGALEEQVKTLTEQVRSLADERDREKARADAAEAKLKDAETGKESAAKEAEEVKAEFSAYRGQQEKAARTARMDKLVSEGKVTPGESKILLAQAEALARIPEPMEFSSGEKATPEDAFWRSLEARGTSPLLGTATPPADFSAKESSAPMPDLSKKI